MSPTPTSPPGTETSPAPSSVTASVSTSFAVTNAAASVPFAGAGGGGSGGMLIIQAAEFDLSAAAADAITARGGLGGPGIGDLSAGGNGGPGLIQLHPEGSARPPRPQRARQTHPPAFAQQPGAGAAEVAAQGLPPSVRLIAVGGQALA